MPATAENLRSAREFLQSRYGGGGTEMMKAIRAALEPSDAPDHVRVVCFMTDGEVGNDFEILGEVQRHPKARVFAFGIGSSVNHFLLDGMARYGRGEVEYVGLKDDGSAAARRFHERVQSPLLTDISIDWGGLPVTDVYPARIPDLFAAKPVVISGRYSSAGERRHPAARKDGGARVHRARSAWTCRPPSRSNAVLATLWARRKVGDLMSQDFRGMQSGSMRGDLKEQITKLGLEFRLVTQFTSFVAVEEKTVTEGGQPRRVEVPVEMPEGMSYEGVFGSESNSIRAMAAPMGYRRMAMGGVVGGVPAQSMAMDVAAAPPPPQLAVRVDPRIAAVIQRAKHGGRPGVDEAQFVFGGDAYVRITLSDLSPAALEGLRKAGFVTVRQSGNRITGHAPVAALEAISKLAFVAWIEPGR